MFPLSSDERRELLAIARKSIEEAVARGGEWKPSRVSPGLQTRAGAFVTLKLRGRLRGCVGNPFAFDSLAETVGHCAVLAATSDDRFSQIAPAEVPDLEIQVSVLSPLTRISPEQVEIGKHGLFIESGRRHGLLLPQVASEHRFSRERFLEETCEKAGLPRDAWKCGDTDIFAFTAEILGESGFPAPLRATVKP